jgi:hypothetical protein
MLKSLNDITAEELAEVERLAGLFFSPREIAVMLELHLPEILEQLDSNEGNFYRAFQKGRLQNEVDLRKAIMQLARAGSSPAQTMAMDILNKSKAKMLDR